MAPAMIPRRGRGRSAAVAVACGALWAAGCTLSAETFAGPLRTRGQGNQKNPEEVKRDEPEAAPVEMEAMPARRVPYTMNVVTDFGGSKHMHQGSSALQTIEEKFKVGFERLEDFVRHAEIHLTYNDGFHKDVVGKLNKEEGTGSAERVLAPYVFKVTVETMNAKTLQLSKPEKHAQPSLNEALDHSIDIMKRSIRHEREKWVQNRKKESRMEGEVAVEMEEEPVILEADLIAEKLEASKDEAVEEFYKKVEDKA